jgi:hypothetical protein
VTACIKMKDVFNQEAVTSVLSHLVHRQPLPPLIMRTLINAWEIHTESRRCSPAPPRTGSCAASLLNGPFAEVGRSMHVSVCWMLHLGRIPNN